MDSNQAGKFAQKYVDKKVPKELKEDVKKMVESIMEHDAFGNPDYQWSLDDFDLADRLGRGKFGRVYLAREKKTGYIVAMKTIIKNEIVKDKVEKLILREIEIQTHLKHENILQLLAWFHDDFRIYLVLEYAGQGELFTHLHHSPGGYFSDHLAAKYTYQVADALLYCHSNHVIHRDIKPENLLLTTSGNVKLADFGWSVHAPSLKRKTMCGTIDYLAPELVEGKEYSTYIDQWCLGVLCYEFLCGYAPFEAKTQKETYKKIASAKVHYPQRLNKDAVDLISRLLVRNEKNRLTLQDVMKHKFILENM